MVVAGSNGVGFVADIGLWAVVRLGTNCATRKSQLAQDDVNNTALERLDFLAKPTSKCWGCFGASLVNVSPWVGEGSGTFEWALGLCSKSLRRGCSVLERNRMHVLEDWELGGSSGWDGLAAPGWSG